MLPLRSLPFELSPSRSSWSCSDGTQGILRLSSAPVRNAAGNIIAGVVSCEDVTDLLEAQETRARLLAAEHTATQMSQLVSNVSHELRTPVSAARARSATDPAASEHRS